MHASIYEGENCMRTDHTRGGKCLYAYRGANFTRTVHKGWQVFAYGTYGTRGGNYSRTNRGGKSMLDIKSYNCMRTSIPDPDGFGPL